MIKQKQSAWCGRCGRIMIQIGDHEGAPCWTPACLCPGTPPLERDADEAWRLWQETQSGGRP